MARDNYIGGAWLPARSGATDPVVDPATGEVARRGGVQRRGRRRRRGRRPPPAPSTSGRAPTPRRAQRAARTRWPTPSRPTSTTLARARDRQRRQAGRRSSSSRWTSPSTTGGSSPPARRFLEGRAAGEYMEDHTSFAAARPARRRRVDRRRGTTRSTWPRGRSGRRSPRATPSCSSRPSSRRSPRCGWRRSPPTSSRPACSTSSPARARPPAPRSCSTPTSRWCRSPATSPPGKVIARAAADSLKRVHLELGGKAPVIVFDDADVDAVVANLAEDCATTTRARTAPRRAGCSPGRGVHDDLVAGLADARRRHARPATRSTPTPRWARSCRPTSSSGSPASSTAPSRPAPRSRSAASGSTATASSTSRRSSSARPGLRDRAARGVRSGRHRAALRRRGRRRSRGPTTSTTAWRRACGPRDVGPGDADGRGAAVRHRVGQRPHPDRVGDAPRRLQAVGLRQGHVDLRDRALHRAQARDGEVVSERRTAMTDHAHRAAPPGSPTTRPPRLRRAHAGVATRCTSGRCGTCRSAWRRRSRPATRTRSTSTAGRAPRVGRRRHRVPRLPRRVRRQRRRPRPPEDRRGDRARGRATGTHFAATTPSHRRARRGAVPAVPARAGALRQLGHRGDDGRHPHRPRRDRPRRGREDRGLVPRPPRHGDVLGRARTPTRWADATQPASTPMSTGIPAEHRPSTRWSCRSTTPPRSSACSTERGERDRLPDHGAGDDEHRHRACPSPATSRRVRELCTKHGVVLDLRRGEVGRDDRRRRRHRALRRAARPGVLRQGDRRRHAHRRVRRHGRR